jgi:arylsulfatase A
MKKTIRQILVIYFMLFHFLTAGAQKVKSPNFIFILTDDQGWTSVSSSMDNRHPENKSDFDETPNIDRLGDEGMRFSAGYAPAALCTPSRRSIQFGQTPIHIGNTTFKKNYDPHKHKWLTIPLMLKSINPGYQTAHYGKWDLRADIFPEDLGYDESDGNTGNNNGDLMTDKKTKWSQVYITRDPKRTFTITARALNFMQRQVQSDHPFYMQLSFYAPHVDMETTQKTYDKFLKKPKGKIHDNPGWAAMLNDLDKGIGEVLDMVDKLGIADNTYIILMSDNGGVEFLPPPPAKHKLDPPSAFEKKMINYPLRGGKWALYEGGTRVPFIVRGPGINPHSYCHSPVFGYDLLPTIGELAGDKQPLPGYLDGASIIPLLHDPANGKVPRKVSDFYFHRYAPSYEHSSIIEGNYKLIKFWVTGKEELYDLNNDIGETQDLAASMPGKVKELDNKLKLYLNKEHSEILDAAISKEKKSKKDKPGSEDDDD